jgi:hypothetical protein
MKRPYLIILVISIALTALAFLHDLIYDIPSVPYTLAMHITDILITGPIYIAIIFAIISGAYFICRKIQD